MEGAEPVEVENGAAGTDEGVHEGLKFGEFGGDAEAVEGFRHLVGSDDAVTVAVEKVEDAAEADSVEARGPQAE